MCPCYSTLSCLPGVLLFATISCSCWPFRCTKQNSFVNPFIFINNAIQFLSAFRLPINYVSLGGVDVRLVGIGREPLK